MDQSICRNFKTKNTITNTYPDQEKFLNKNSAKIPEATTNLDSKQQEVTDSIQTFEIQKLQITNSTYRNSSILDPNQTTPETVLENQDAASVQNSMQRQFEISENKEEDEEITDWRYRGGVGVFEGGAARSAEVGASAKGKVEHKDLLVAGAEMVTRPPPKPPHLQSQEGVFDGAEDVADLNSQGWQRSKASDGAVDRSCHGCGGEVDDKSVSSAGVGASTRGKWSTSMVEDGATGRTGVPEAKPHGTTSTRWFSAVTRRLRRFVLLTPPPLLATVLPWNRDGDGMGEQEQELEAKVQGAEVVGATGKKVAPVRLESSAETKWCTLPSVSGTVINRVTVGDAHHGRAVVGCPCVGELLHFLRSQWRRKEEWG